jgi:hypothetical protein
LFKEIKALVIQWEQICSDISKFSVPGRGSCVKAGNWKRITGSQTSHYTMVLLLMMLVPHLNIFGKEKF